MEHEHRRLIKFGNSSHIISVPNNWIKKNNLKKGDLIYVNENGNGELILSPELKKIQNEINIEDENVEKLQRKIVSSYIGGYDIINIKIKNFDNIDIIRNYLSMLMSFEIINQTSDKVVAKDLLDINEISIDNLIRRIDNVVRSMVEDSKLSYKENNYENIYKRDYYINKLTYLLLRVIKKCLDRPKLMNVVGLRYNKLIETWELIAALENIADHSKRISRLFTRVKNSKVIKEILNVYGQVYKDYLEAMNAYYKNNRSDAYDIAARKGDIIDVCNDISKKTNDPNIANILEKIKALEISVRDICRSVYQ